MKSLKFALLLSASVFVMTSSFANAEPFNEFLDSVRSELKAQKIDVEIFNKAMEGVKAPDKEVGEKLVKQPESVFSFPKYLDRLASEFRKNEGLKKQAEHKADLERISKEYGIPEEVILSLWGVETAYGKLPGNFKIIPSLASLAYESHRREFFRSELIQAVKIVHDGHIELDDLTGSWAGAMGQCQFMPSSFYRFAADGNGDGKIDIWKTEADVFASTANYLKKSGWKNTNHWGEAVTLTKILPKIDFTTRGLSEPKTMKEWYAMGVAHKKNSNKKLVNDETKARMFLPEGPSSRAYLVYDNFDVIMRWNRSSYFAFSVLTLADKIAGRPAL